MKAEQKKLPKSQIEINFELTEEEFKKYIDRALEQMKKYVKADGFRQGHVPEKIVEEKAGKENVLMEAGDLAVREIYLKYIEDNKLEPAGQPEVSITKVAQGSPFGFKAVITILPEVELPDYKVIAKDIEGQDISVSEEEIQNSLNYLQKSRAKFTAKNEPAEKGDFVEIKYQNRDINDGKEIDDKFTLGEGGFMQGFEDAITGMKAGEEKDITAKFPDHSPKKDMAGKEANFKIKLISVQKMELPEVNDEFAKELGAFDTLVALKDNIKQGLTAEKTEGEKQRRRAEILEKVAEKTKFEMPEAIVEYEQKRLLDELKSKIAQRVKISFEEYLASIKKTEDEVKETYKKEAEKRLRGFLILRGIAKQENVEISDKELEEETQKALENYKKQHAGHDHGEIDKEQLKEYTKGVLENEKIFQILEDSSSKATN